MSAIVEDVVVTNVMFKFPVVSGMKKEYASALEEFAENIEVDLPEFSTEILGLAKKLKSKRKTKRAANSKAAKKKPRRGAGAVVEESTNNESGTNDSAAKDVDYN